MQRGLLHMVVVVRRRELHHIVRRGGLVHVVVVRRGLPVHVVVMVRRGLPVHMVVMVRRRRNVVSGGMRLTHDSWDVVCRSRLYRVNLYVATK